MKRHVLLSDKKIERKYTPQQKLYAGAEWFLRMEYRRKRGSLAHKIKLISCVAGDRWNEEWAIEGGGHMKTTYILSHYIHP